MFYAVLYHTYSCSFHIISLLIELFALIRWHQASGQAIFVRNVQVVFRCIILIEMTRRISQLSYELMNFIL